MIFVVLWSTPEMPGVIETHVYGVNSHEEAKETVRVGFNVTEFSRIETRIYA